VFVRFNGGFDRNSRLRITGPRNLGTFGIDDSSNWVASTPASGTRYRFSAWVARAPHGALPGSRSMSSRRGAPIGAGIVSAPVRSTPTGCS
jgi:hypothetical protein